MFYLIVIKVQFPSAIKYSIIYWPKLMKNHQVALAANESKLSNGLGLKMKGALYIDKKSQQET